MTALVQYRRPDGSRSVGVVSGDRLRRLEGVLSVYELAQRALAEGETLEALVHRTLGNAWDDYQELIEGGLLLPPLDHPDPAHLLLSGTGLTHLASAHARDEMHDGPAAGGERSDSLRLYELGLREGKPDDGSLGVQPEWFYKGDGHSLTAPGQPFVVPSFSLNVGEEPEIAGVYVVSRDGVPHRLGHAIGNELSDHVTEAQNYLYLAHSKLRPCAIGPELHLGRLPTSVSGRASIKRGGDVIWSRAFSSGEANMSHRLTGLEHHHFKYSTFRRPGSAHVHFFGTSTLSFADGVLAQPGDVFEIDCPNLGKPLVNAFELDDSPPVEVAEL